MCTRLCRRRCRNVPSTQLGGGTDANPFECSAGVKQPSSSRGGAGLDDFRGGYVSSRVMPKADGNSELRNRAGNIICRALGAEMCLPGSAEGGAKMCRLPTSGVGRRQIFQIPPCLLKNNQHATMNFGIEQETSFVVHSVRKVVYPALPMEVPKSTVHPPLGWDEGKSFRVLRGSEASLLPRRRIWL
ncbi:hypothetical protein DFS34DRAFT_223068 [Phlyctochytrium arcticum]|nr:hypothetical protein DFS34DRAFT_223068 [Phlyctochytrium arcticum]